MRVEHYTNSDLLKFKGVVSQPNGRWGAQIYVKHQRVWLGTFKTNIDAAMAYDSASIKIRTGDNQRNFPWSSISKHEPTFQTFYSKQEIVDMIKDGSYPSKFSEFVRTQIDGQDLDLSSNQDFSGFSCKRLFQKELTPSDVSKLNRLVVPKKYAVRFFPRIANVKEGTKVVDKTDVGHLEMKDSSHVANDNEDNKEIEKNDEVHLTFKDKTNRQWQFRYCYWQSSQSYVFTRGWNRFVKENKLKANDTIAFYTCESRKKKRGKEKESFWLIDVGFPGELTDVKEIEVLGENVDPEIDLCLRLGPQVVKEEEDELVEAQAWSSFKDSDPKKGTSFKLFGVPIN